MQTIIESLREIFYYLRQYKSRTAMTLFGITWGTLTVVLLLAFGAGAKRQLQKSMHGLGESICIVWPGRTSLPYQGFGIGRSIPLTAEDVAYVRREVGGIRRISPEFSWWQGTIRRKDRINRPNITGVLPEYGPMRNIWWQPGGRWLNDLDVRQKRRVVFLGNNLRDFLFGKNKPAVGRYVYINDIPFLVIGVLKKKIQNSTYNQRDADRAFIPMTTFQAIFGETYISDFVYQLQDANRTEQVKAQLYQALGRKFKFDPKDKEALSIWDTTEIDQFVSSFSLGFTIFLGIIGSITLLVGGIGLANIMYVVVQERTREIGIRRTVGARQAHIMMQFLLEAFLIIGIGALIGFVMAVGMIRVFAALPLQSFKEQAGTPYINLWVAGIAAFLLFAIGFLAGFFPARRAAKLNIIDSLRF